MDRNEFYIMREELMNHIEGIIEENVSDVEMRDGLIIELCNKVCEVMDPVGLGY
jgi:hypothetical protein